MMHYLDLLAQGLPSFLDGIRWGWHTRWGSFWIGCHWSPWNRRFCINLLPCVTLWVVLPGGKEP
jgi:peptidoglycan/LPS O-acetylase OafA/YrhL